MAKETTTITMDSEGTIKLRNGIKVDGKLIKELKYNIDKISMPLYTEADARASAELIRYNAMKNTATALSETYLNYFGMAGVLCVEDRLSFEDLERITGTDIKKLGNIGRLFINASEEDDGASEDLKASSETSPKPSVQA